LIEPHIKELKVRYPPFYNNYSFKINLIEVWGLTKPSEDEDLEDEKFVRIDAKDPLLP